MVPVPQVNTNATAIVEAVIRKVGKRLVVATPLGLGKANVFLNTLYARAKGDSSIDLTIITALTLSKPRPKSDLERRFLEPFLERVYGGCPELLYDLERGRHPSNVRIQEFYFPAGKLLRDEEAQKNYVSANYTHVARDILAAGVNVIAQMVAESPAEPNSMSFGCNPDLTLDVLEGLEKDATYPWALVGEVNRELPYMYGDAVVAKDRFHYLLRGGDCDARLFGVPKGPVSRADYAIGLHASSLVRDGGTIQVGIGSLGDAFVHALILRQRGNDTYREILTRLQRGGADTQALVDRTGGLAPLTEGVYAATEMFIDGFAHLYREGLLKRRVHDGPDDREGAVLHGGFFLGCEDFYTWIRSLPEAERRLFRMTSVRKVNHLYGNEALYREQRVHARFFNSCLMMTIFGAAVSDGLENGHVVSGVGGQYNFVAMAHELPTARSVLQLRATRGSGADLHSNIVFNYGHTTIPRHLRDVVITEYGIADLRGKTDEKVVASLIGIADSRFQLELIRRAQQAGKLATDFRLPEHQRHNLPETLKQTLGAFSAQLPAHPFGTSFTAEELSAAAALKRLKGMSHWQQARALLFSARPDPKTERVLARLRLDQPRTLKERIYRRLVASAV